MNDSLKQDVVLKNRKELFISGVTKLEALNPLSVLARGYSIVKNNNKILTNTSDISVGDQLEIAFNSGTAIVDVTQINYER